MEQIKSYGSAVEGVTPKDTLVKYEFHTTDEQGNKVMDPMSKDEALQMMQAGDFQAVWRECNCYVFGGWPERISPECP